jgi:cytochrome c5
MSKEKDQVFFRNFSIVVGILAVMMLVFIVVARIVGIDEEADMERRAGAVSERTAPMGEISVAGEEGEIDTMPVADEETIDTGVEMAAASNESAVIDGKATYDNICAACHGSGIPGIPQLGDAAAWAPRIEQGTDTLYSHAIDGYTGSSGMMMLPKAGNPDLSDDAVKAAVDYMVANSQ